MRLLIRIGISLATSALGLLLAALLVAGFHVQIGGFLAAVVVLTVAQAALAPVATKIGQRYAPALMGGIGIISTLVALLIASLIPGGIAASGVTTWILAAVVVWICTAAGGWILVALLLRKRRAAAS